VLQDVDEASPALRRLRVAEVARPGSWIIKNQSGYIFQGIKKHSPHFQATYMHYVCT
jgi:hypothetical protein